jgi:diguanylate cyclase (GGDEF)-like protein/PAS domain S-box-containing protein
MTDETTGNSGREFMDSTEMAEDLFYALFQGSPVGTILIDQENALLDANRFIFKYFNQNEQPVKGKRFGNLFHCETVYESGNTCGSQEACQKCLIRNALNRVVANGERFDDFELAHEFRLNGRKDIKWFSVSATPVKHQDDFYAVVTFVDITEQKHREETLVLLGITDGLTGLYNRRFIMEQIKQQAGKTPRSTYSLAMLDIDNFKQINDTYGHLTGDSVLQALAEIITNSIRYSDFAGRYGGEEFLILFPETTEQAARMIVDRISHRLKEHIFATIPRKITFSAGVIEGSSDNPASHLDMIGKADELMYQAKVNGKDRIESGRYEGCL